MSTRRLVPALVFSALAHASGAAEPTARPSAQAATASPPRVVRRVPVDLSVFPPLSFNGEAPAVNNLSVALAGAHSAELRGVALAPVHWADGDVTGVQATSVAASAGGLLRGAQLSQVAALARAVRGAQLAGAVAYAGGEVTGAQLSLGAAIARGTVRGAQIALVNVGGEVRGIQLGIVNLARKVAGLQLGLVNLSRSADGAVGLLSLAGDGRHDVELWAAELTPVNAGARLGGRRVHGLLVAGIDPDEVKATGETRWAAGVGAGTGVEIGRRVTLDLDLLARLLVYDGEEPQSGIGSLRLVAGFRPIPQAALFAGPTVNLLVSDVDRPDVRLGRSVGSHGRLWAGFVAGVRI